MSKKIAFACDHGGYELKATILNWLKENGYEVVDFGCDSTASVDYPDYALPASQAVAKGECDLGILVCGTGIGMSIAANKMKGIRAAVVSDYFSAKFTRLHNNTNILCLGGRVVGVGLGLELVDVFVDTEYEGGRHQTRLDMIADIENNR